MGKILNRSNLVLINQDLISNDLITFPFRPRFFDNLVYGFFWWKGRLGGGKIKKKIIRLSPLLDSRAQPSWLSLGDTRVFPASCT